MAAGPHIHIEPTLSTPVTSYHCPLSKNSPSPHRSPFLLSMCTSAPGIPLAAARRHTCAPVYSHTWTCIYTGTYLDQLTHTYLVLQTDTWPDHACNHRHVCENTHDHTVTHTHPTVGFSWSALPLLSPVPLCPASLTFLSSLGTLWSASPPTQGLRTCSSSACYSFCHSLVISGQAQQCCGGVLGVGP